MDEDAVNIGDHFNIEPAAGPPDVFALLYHHLKGNQTRALEFFKEFDKLQTGALDLADLTRMVKSVLPSASSLDVEYFLAMLDMGSQGVVTFPDLFAACRECQTYSASVRNHEPAAENAINKLQDHLSKYNFDAMRAFKRFDEKNLGYLEYSHVVKMLKALMPQSTLSERRYIMVRLKIMLDLSQSTHVNFEEMQRGLEPDWMKRDKRVVLHQSLNLKQDLHRDYAKQSHRTKVEIMRQQERESWADAERMRVDKEEEEYRQYRRQRNKEEAGKRNRAREQMRRDAAAIAVTVKEELQERDRQRQIEEQETADLRASQDLYDRMAKSRQSREARRIREEEEDKNYSLQMAAARLEQEILTKFQYQKHERYVNVAEFANPDPLRASVQSLPERQSTPVKPTHPEVWATLKVVDFEALPPSRYSMLPATKRYEYYKKYGFAGKGARTSWAFNPTKRPVRTSEQSVWPGKGLA